MVAAVRTFFWLFAILGNVLAVAIVGLSLKAIGTGGTGMEMAGSAVAGGLVLVYALALAIVPTCLAISVDGLTRS